MTRLACTVLFGLSLAACASGPARRPMQEIVASDQIEAELRADTALRDSEIDVDTDDGVVVLTGAVDSEAARARAERIALSHPGVEQVINGLVVGGEAPAPVLHDDDVSEREDSSESMADPSWGVGQDIQGIGDDDDDRD